MRKQSLVLGVAVLLISGGIASAQIAVPPGQDNPVATPPSVATPNKPHPETNGQNFRDDRLQSDRDSKMVPTPVPPPAMLRMLRADTQRESHAGGSQVVGTFAISARSTPRKRRRASSLPNLRPNTVD